MTEPKQIAIDYDTEDGSYRSYVKSISMGGVFIETEESFIVGQKITLTFSSGYDHNSFMLTGKVTNRVPKGIEVEFENLTQQELSLLSSLSETEND